MNAARTEYIELVLSLPERRGLRYLAKAEGVAEAEVLLRMLNAAISSLPTKTVHPVEGSMMALFSSPS